MDETFNDQLPDGHQLDGDNCTEDVVYFLLQDPDNEWWDRVATADVKERRDAVLKIAFEKAYQEGVEAYGENLGEWRWGDLHTIYFENATLGKSGISLIENLFNRGPFPVNGSTTVVQKTCWSKESDFTVYCIPALRQVVDLGDLTNTREIHSVGQSGHPASSHYDDFIELWRNFDYISSNWLRSQAEATKHDTLTLQPR
jgi:penicillin amidase